MAYFSNGTEGMDYQSKYCDRCVNYRNLDDDQGPGCPIWDLHMLHNYDDEWEDARNWFIPMDPPEKIHAGECKMFEEIPQIPEYPDWQEDWGEACSVEDCLNAADIDERYYTMFGGGRMRLQLCDFHRTMARELEK